MVIDQMIEAAMIEIKENLERFCRGSAEEALSLESAKKITKGIQESVAAAGRAALTTDLMANEEQKDIIVVDGETFRLKELTNKDATDKSLTQEKSVLLYKDLRAPKMPIIDFCRERHNKRLD